MATQQRLDALDQGVVCRSVRVSGRADAHSDIGAAETIDALTFVVVGHRSVAPILDHTTHVFRPRFRQFEFEVFAVQRPHALAEKRITRLSPESPSKVRATTRLILARFAQTHLRVSGLRWQRLRYIDGRRGPPGPYDVAAVGMTKPRLSDASTHVVSATQR